MSEGFKLEEFETKSEKLKRRQNNTALVHSTVSFSFFLSCELFFFLLILGVVGIPGAVEYNASVLEPEPCGGRMGCCGDGVWAGEGGGCRD